MKDREFREIPFGDIPPYWNLIGTPEYMESIYRDGVRNPVLIGEWEERLHLIGGNRRVLSLQAAHAKAKEDGSLDSRPWLEKLPAVIYKGMNPIDITAWALADNEERSDNPLHAYLLIKAAQEAGDWDKVANLFQYNKQRLRVVMEFEKLTPELLKAVIEGRISKKNALDVARLGARQEYVMKMAEARVKNTDKPVTITSKDIKAAKEARATAVLQVVSDKVVPTKKGEVNVTVDQPMFLLGDTASIEELSKAGKILNDFKVAFEKANAEGKKIYRLVEV